MDARTAESPVISEQRKLAPAGAGERAVLRPRWPWLIAARPRRHDRRSASWLLRRGAEPGTLLSPPLIALLLIAILLPAIALMVLYARKVAVRRAEQGGLGSGRLHVRLVALVHGDRRGPTVLVAIFASLLFQSGLEFWFSNRARTCSRIRSRSRRRPIDTKSSGSAHETVTAMSAILPTIFEQMPIDDPRFRRGLCAHQVLTASLSEAIIFTYGRTGRSRPLRLVNPLRPAARQGRFTPASDCASCKPAEVVADELARSDRRCSRGSTTARTPISTLRACSIPQFREQIQRANDVLNDYRALLSALADQPAALQCRAAARRADHRRPVDPHRAEARRPAGAPGRRAGRRRRPDRGRRFLGPGAGRRRPKTKSRRWPPPSTG